MRSSNVKAALLASLALAALHTAYVQPWTVDDAYIAFRYAENWSRGLGPVYNPGERVEGYTTFLWVAQLAAARTLGAEPERAAKVLGVLWAGASFVLLARAHRFVAGLTARDAAVATLLLGSCGFFTAWIAGGLEVPLVAFWLLLAALLHARSVRRPDAPQWAAATGLACALAALSRPDAALLFAVCCADRLRDAVRGRGRGVLWLAAGFALLFVPYQLWRFDYYGYALPNTFYAKVGVSPEQVGRGLKYVTRFAGPALLLLAPVLAALAYGDRLRRRHPRCGYLGAFAILHLLYVIAVGGDALPAFRFFASIAPILCLLAALALGAVPTRGRRLAAIVACAVLWGLLQSATHRDLHDRVVHGNVGREGKLVGLWLARHAPPDALLATNTAGSIPYFSKLRTIDMLGLTDAHIAPRSVADMGRGVAGHEKGDGAYVLSRRPDYIQLGSSRGRRVPNTLGGRELVRLPAFRRDYVLREHLLPGGLLLTLYERRAAAGGRPLAPGRAPP